MTINDLTSDELVRHVWHWRVKDGFSWKFCAGILTQDGYEATAKQVKSNFHRFFKNLTGCDVYIKCPECEEGETRPRRSQWGYFVGCSTFPRCKFVKYPRFKIEFD